MTLRLTLFSQEVEDFVVEIKIDSEATFADLHRLILDDCRYEEADGQKFLLCDDDWRVEKQVCLRDTERRADEDVYLMERTLLSDLMEDEGQRVAYVFDPSAKRYFLMELTENIFAQPEPKPRVSRRHGTAPQQTMGETALAAADASTSGVSLEEDFYGDDGFDDDELDPEGFEIRD